MATSAKVRSARQDACTATDGRCPRCGGAREPDQRYCVECGLRLPVVVGTVPALRRRWLRRFGWYPGDWIWLTLPALAIAVAGAAVAIAVDQVGRRREPTRPSRRRSCRAAARGAASRSLPRPPRADGRGPAGPSGPRRKRLDGPARVVSATRGEAAPRAAARRAARAGLPDVGVLDSSDFSSLHPGYFVVFSGIYTAETDADAALRTARARGFGSAYSREISRVSAASRSACIDSGFVVS